MMEPIRNRAYLKSKLPQENYELYVKAAKSIDLEFTSGCTIKEKEQGGIFMDIEQMKKT